jgi:hypothetical protein
MTPVKTTPLLDELDEKIAALQVEIQKEKQILLPEEEQEISLIEEVFKKTIDKLIYTFKPEVGGAFEAIIVTAIAFKAIVKEKHPYTAKMIVSIVLISNVVFFCPLLFSKLPYFHQ